MQLIFSHSEQQAGNAKSFHFVKPDGFSHVAGQYQTWRLAPGGKANDDITHWFTISAAPSEDTVALTTRVTESAFKQKLDSLQPGDTIEAENVTGDFTWESDEDVILIAGGVGVTPYRSMLVERARRGRQLNATLVYANRDEDVVFQDEFEALQTEHPELTIHYLIGQSLTADSLLELVPEMKTTLTYLSGPEPMVDAIGDELKAKGVENLKQDWFPGYTDQTY